MEVRVRLYGTLRRFSQSGTPGLWVGTLPPGARLTDLLKEIGVNEREVAAAAMGSVVVPMETEIQTDTEIILVTHVGGG